MIFSNIQNMVSNVNNKAFLYLFDVNNELGLWQIEAETKFAAIFQTTFSNAFSWMKNVWISIKILLKCVPKGQINKSQHWVI